MPTITEPAPLPELTTDDLSRYSRHLILPEVGMEGQQKLKAARVLCVGTGGLGSPLALYLAAAGIGTLGLVDFDVVDASNLQRQIIHSTKDIGRKKLDSAEEKLNALNPALNVVKHETMLTSANALDILKDYDIVADGTDNFPTRYLVNDACVLLGKPNAYGSIFRFEGQASVFATEGRPLLSLPLSRAAAAGPGAQLRRGRSAGHSARTGRRDPGHRSHQADPRQRRVRSSAACCWSTRSTCASANSSCARIPSARCAAHNPTVTELIDYQQFCGIVPETPQEEKTVKNGIPQITVKELKRRIDAGEDVFTARRARALRIPDRPDRRKADPAERCAAAARRDRPRPRDRRAVPQPARAASASPSSSSSPAIPRSSTSPAASSPGATRSTPRCRNTEANSGKVHSP